jgi:hypothetical protein
MFGFGKDKQHNYSIEVWKGSSGNTGPCKGTYEEVMAKAYEAKERPGVTKVIVTRDGKAIARL